MGFKEITEIAVNNGLSIAIVCFYLMKDYKFNNELVQTLQKICDKLDKKE